MPILSIIYQETWKHQNGFIKIFKLVSEDVHDVTSQKCGCVNRMKLMFKAITGLKVFRSLQSGKD